LILEADKSNSYSVCSLARLSGFGEETVSNEVNNPNQSGPQLPLDKFKSHIKGLMKTWDDGVQEEHFGWKKSNSNYIPKLAAVWACTASGQKVTMEHFRSLGFKEIGPYEKLKHPDSTLTFWFISADQLCRELGYVSKYDPRTKEERGY